MSFTLKPGAVDALHDVLRRGDGAGDDVRLGFQADAHHADGVLDAALLVDDELLRDDVQDLAVHGDHDGLGRVDDAVHVFLGDLAVLAGDGNDAAGVDALDVAPGHAGVHPVHLAARHELRRLDGVLDGLHGGLDVDDDAPAQAAGGRGAHADDLQLSGLVELADDGADLRRADVQPDDQFRWSHRPIPLSAVYTTSPLRKSSS